MKTLGRNGENDIFLDGSGFAVAKDMDAQRQIIEALLLTQKGELQLDEEGGIDYFGTVLQSPRYIEPWAMEVRTKIEDLPFVSSVEDFEYQFDAKTSTLFWSMRVINTDGETITMADRQLQIDGKPGIDVKWDDVYEKPIGVDQAIEAIKNMNVMAQGQELNDSSSLRDVKKVINEIIFDANDPEFTKTRTISFEFEGVPLGIVIDFSNLRITKVGATECLVRLSDGAEAIVGSDGKVEFNGSPRHTITSANTFSISIIGDVSGIEVADTDLNLPIFLTSNGRPFTYLTKFNVGKVDSAPAMSRVPLAKIGTNAFRGFKNLTTINWAPYANGALPDGDFGEYAFAGCSSLNSLGWIPTEIKTVGEGCFKDCSSLTSLTGFPAVTTLPDYCFSGCSKLSSLSGLPSGTITEFGEYAFAGCSSLTNLNSVPTSIQTFGTGCFKDCSGMTEILYPPEALTTIGDNCFENCTSLVAVYIPSNVTSIGDYAFGGCSALTNIRSDALAVPTINEHTFDTNSDEVKVYVPADSLSAYASAPFWEVFAAPENNRLFPYGVYTFTLNGIVAGTTLLNTTSLLSSDSIWSISYGDETESDDYPEQRFLNEVTALPEHTYANAFLATQITIKGYITEIAAASSTAYPFFATSEGGAFPNLKSIAIADSPLQFLGDYAFAQCTGLNSVSLGFSSEPAYRLGEKTFFGCTSLTSAEWLVAGLGKVVEVETLPPQYYPAFGEGCFQDSGLVSLTFGADAWNFVTSLPAYCFSGTKITSLENIGVNVEEFGSHCFYACKSLTSITSLMTTRVGYLPDYCFAECWALASLEGIDYLYSTIIQTDGETTTRTIVMGEHCFENCTHLTTLGDPLLFSAITDLPAYTFCGCTALTSLDGIANRNGKEMLTLGAYCFQRCTSLAYGMADGTPTTHSPLSQIADTSITEIPDACFMDCTGLQNLIGLEKITTIGSSAFAGCTGLVSTSGLGFGLSSISYRAFYRCANLAYVSCPASTPPSLADNSFESTSVSTLYVAPGMESSYQVAANWSRFSTISSRKIVIHIEGINEISDTHSTYTKVIAETTTSNGTIPGCWYVSYGDGYVASLNGGTLETLSRKTIPAHTYLPELDNYDLTLFGDVLEIGVGDPNGDFNPETETVANAIRTPFLGDLKDSIYTIGINSAYLQTIGDFCFYDYNHLNNLTLNCGAGSTIGACAFKQNYNLEFIERCMATTLKAGAFYDAALVNLDPFSYVTEVGDFVFAKSGNKPDLQSRLISITGLSAAMSIGDYAFALSTALASTKGLGSTTSIGAWAFSGCSALKEVAGLSANLTTIGEGCFSECDAIRMVAMPPAVPPTTDGTTLFANCFTDNVYQTAPLYVPAGRVDTYRAKDYWSNFYTIKVRCIQFSLSGMPARTRLVGGTCQVTASGTWVISYGEGERSYTYAAGTTVLPAYTFTQGGAKIIQISGAVTSISAVSKTAYPIFATTSGSTFAYLKKIEATPDIELTSFGAYSFMGCTGLAAITDMPTLTSIGSNCFQNCSALTDVSGLTGVATIGNYGFAGCTGLKGLKGLHSAITIGDYAFSGCLKLETIDGLGLNVSTIGEYAFQNCPLIEVQMLAEVPPTIAATTFTGLDQTTIPLFVLNRSIAAYKEAAVWSAFTSITSRRIELTLNDVAASTIVSGDGGHLLSYTFWAVDFGDDKDVVGFVATGEEPMSFPNYEYSDPGNYEISIEGGITSISSDETARGFLKTTFEGTETNLLTKVEASGNSKLEKVGDYAFYGCSGITYISVSTAKVIGEYAFYGCSGINALSGFASVETIGEYAFYGCTGLPAIVGFSPNLKMIGASAFGGGIHIGYIQISAPSKPSVMVNLHTKGLPILDEYTFGNTSIMGETASIGPNGAEIVPSIDGLIHYFTGAVKVYVPSHSIEAYRNAQYIDIGDQTYTNYWSYFQHKDASQGNYVSDISSRIITFHLSDVPANTRFLSGTSRIKAEGDWMIDWGDGTIDQMSASNSTFPTHIYSREASAWENARTITIPDTNETIEVMDFDIVLSGEITYLGANSAESSPILVTSNNATNLLTSVTCTDAMPVITIGQYCFKNCTGLKSATGFTHVTTIEPYAFYGCTSLYDLGTIGSSNTPSTAFLEAATIDDYAFSGCTRLASLAGLPAALTLGDYVFYGCTRLVSTAGIGSSYAGDTKQGQFGSFCFGNCSLSAITVTPYVNPPYITATTFNGVDPNSTPVYVARDSIDAYKAAPYWRDFWRSIMGETELRFTIRIPSSGVTLISGTSMVMGTYTIEWGDGTSEIREEDGTLKVLNSEGLPQHTYSGDAGEVTIILRGGITGIASMGGNNYPFLASALGTALPGFSSFSIASEGTELIQGIGEATFKNCTELTTASFGTATISTIGKEAFAGCPLLSSMVFNSGLTSIGEGAFRGDASITSLSIPETTTAIGEEAFRYCSSLASLSWSAPTGIIKEYAFDGCRALSTIDSFPSVPSIPIGAFQNCSALNSVNFISTGLHDISAYAFRNCGLWGFDADLSGTGLTKIGIESFAGTNITHLALPNTVSQLGNYAFVNCKNLKRIDWAIPKPLPSGENAPLIGEGCFAGCTGLQMVTSFGGVATLNNYAFFLCSSLTGDSATAIMANASGSIGSYCFAGCIAIGNVEIPADVTSLREGCFNCSKEEFLISMMEDAGSSSSDSDDADGYAIGEIDIGTFYDKIIKKYANSIVDVWDKIDNIVYRGAPGIGPTRITWSYSGNNAKIGAGCFMNCTALQLAHSTLPTINFIPMFAFYGVDSPKEDLTWTFLPSSSMSSLTGGAFCFAHMRYLTSLNRGANQTIMLADAMFLGCSELSSIEGLSVPAGKGIPNACFYGCSSLSDISYLKSTSSIKTLGKYCFAKCTALTSGSDVTSNSDITQNCIHITEIGDGCFMGIGMTSFSGLQNVQVYPFACFKDCTSLTEITRFCPTTVGLPVLYGDAFAGCFGVASIDLTIYTDGVLRPQETSRKTESGGEYRSSDPFSGVRNKKNIEVEAPSTLIDAYVNDPYWGLFSIKHDSSDMKAQVICTVPPTGGTLYLTGNVSIPIGGVASINWGDGSHSEQITPAMMSHTYDGASWGGAQVSVSFFGDIETLYGITAGSGPLVWTCTPLLSTSAESITTGNSNSWITSVYIREGVVAIGESCFANCPNMQSVYLPSTIEGIGAQAFYNSSTQSSAGLQYVLTSNDGLPNLRTIGDCAFLRTRIQNLSFLSSATQLDEINLGAFAYCSLLNDLTGLPQVELSKLGQFCFAYCGSLASLNGFNHLTLTGKSLPNRCFSNCTRLTSATTFPYIDPNVNRFIAAVFGGCKGITTLWDGSASYLPELIEIGSGCFSSTGITSLKGLPSTLTKIGDATGTTGTFQNTPLENLAYLPPSITYLPPNCFKDCQSLVTLGGGSEPNEDGLSGTACTTLYKGCFQGCISLQSLSGMGNKITTLGDSCFAGCSNVNFQNLNGLSSAITSLPASCFQDCSSITHLYHEVTGGGHVSDVGNIISFGNSCFAATNLADLEGISENIVSLGSQCFANCINLGDLFGLQSCSSLRVLPTSCFQGCSTLTKVVYLNGATTMGLPISIEEIYGNCFNGCAANTGATLTVIVSRYVYDDTTGDYDIIDLQNDSAATPVFPDNVVIYVDVDSSLMNDAVQAYQDAWTRYASKIQALP